MGARTGLTKTLAIAGTVLLLLPVPLVMSSLGSAPQGLGWRGQLVLAAMDLTLLVLAGECLLVLAAVRCRSRLAPIAAGLGLSASIPVAAIILNAAASGAALGSTSAWVVLGATVFWLGAIVAAIAGLSLLRALFAPTHSPARG